MLVVPFRLLLVSAPSLFDRLSGHHSGLERDEGMRNLEVEAGESRVEQALPRVVNARFAFLNHHARLRRTGLNTNRRCVEACNNEHGQ